MKPKTYAALAGVLFLLAAAFAIVDAARGAPSPSFTRPYGIVLDVVLASIWLAGAESMVVPNRASTTAGLFATFALLNQGIIVCIATRRPAGLPFIVAAAIAALCVKRGAAALGFQPLPENPPAAVTQPPSGLRA